MADKQADLCTKIIRLEDENSRLRRALKKISKREIIVDPLLRGRVYRTESGKIAHYALEESAEIADDVEPIAAFTGE